MSAEQPEVRSDGTAHPDVNKPAVHGYTPQSAKAIRIVNANKLAEERILRLIDDLYQANTSGDARRWLNIGRTHIEQAFMAINRSIFQPQRVMLPTEDNDGFPPYSFMFEAETKGDG